MSEFRLDPVIGRWVIISGERMQRPADFRYRREPKTGSGFCPFCPGNEYTTPPEILALRNPSSPPNGPGWSLRVVPNKFPVLQVENTLDTSGDGSLFRSMGGVGAHEVIIETPDHDRGLAELPPGSMVDILRAYRQRITDLEGDRRLRYVMIFKNHGPTAGATLEHPHTQLIALPVIPRVIQEEIDGAASFFRDTGKCIFCDIISAEMEDGRRVVLENDHFITITPFAPSTSFETWILPKRHISLFEQSEGEFEALALMIQELLRRTGRLLGDPDYNFVLHTSPLREGGIPHYHWHLEVAPRVGQTAGFEWGAGFFINTTPPEEAAAFLRNVTVE